MNRSQKMFLAAMIMVFVGLVVAFLFAVSLPSDQCVRSAPDQIKSGAIYTPPPGLFTGSHPTEYYLYYRGIFVGSGEECFVRVRVTEQKYDKEVH